METKLNIAKILKDKPKGTKLYSPLFGDVYLSCIYNDGLIKVKHHDGLSIFQNNGRYYNYSEAEPLLFPSKEMRDWSKFAWKKGDVLISNNGKREVLFKTWANDSYTKFIGYHSLITYSDEEVEYDNSRTVFNTNDFIGIEAEGAAKTYINTIEERLGGKLNLETLEIEKSAFKDGDILCVIANSTDYHYILIYEGQDDEHIYRYVTMLENHSLIIEKGSYFTKPKDYSIRYATEEEKQQLFDALAKEGKAWDAEKKLIVDLKPKVELKPFDKVLVRDNKSDYWRASLFSHIDKNGCHYCVWASWNYCIPYEGNESLLGTTKDVEG